MAQVEPAGPADSANGRADAVAAAATGSHRLGGSAGPAAGPRAGVRVPSATYMERNIADCARNNSVAPNGCSVNA